MIEKIKKEIQRQLQESEERLSHINARGFVAPNEEQLIVHLKGLLSFIDALEVKEGDLDALGVLANHLIACDAHGVTPKYSDRELDFLEGLANNKVQKGE